MKKIIIIIILLGCILIGKVSAGSNDTNINIDYLDNVYGNFVIGDLFYWNQIGLTYANNEIAYCIEPGKWVNENIYDSYTDFQIKNLNDSQKHTLELYAYYGYNYPNHRTTKYYLATQELIWRFLGIKEMYWSTESVHNGERINVDNEKEVINALISKHNDLPSFHNMTFEAISGHPIELYDTNNVFDKFDVIGNLDHDIYIAGNNVTIYPKKVGNTAIKFLKYPSRYKPSFIYTKNDSQAVVTLGLSNKIYTQVNLKISGYKFNLHKKDSINMSNIPSSEGSLKGAIYQLSNGLDYEKEIVTDELGNGTLSDVPAGNYILKETKASQGYKLDKTEYKVSINSDTSLEIEMDVFEDVITNDIELIKVFSSGETGLVKPEINISFAIYDKNNNFVKEITTDTKGRAKTTLNYGTYTIKQINTSPNYEKVKDFVIFVDTNDGEPLEYILTDNLINSRINIVKVDEFNNPIKQEGIKFKIKNLGTNQYVEQKIIYPEEKIISVFETNKDGQLTTPYPVSSGNYQIEEITSPEGYLLDKKPYLFSLNENTNLVEDKMGKILPIYFKNNQPRGKVIINKTGNKRTWKIGTSGKFYVEEFSDSLTGVEFDLISNEDIIINNTTIYKKGTVIEKLVTLNGVASSQNIPLGKYCVKETRGLEGYLIKDSEECFELKYIDSNTELIVKEINIVNQLIKTNIEILKFGEEMTGIINNKGVYKEMPLSNVKFGLFNKEDMLIDGINIIKDTKLTEQVTDISGKINISEIPIGNYYIKELESDKNHIIDPNNYDINITEFNNYQQLRINNKKKRTNVLISKIDKDTKQVLGNATFKLEDSSGNEKWTGSTNNKGIILLEDIEYGNYFVNEVKAPEGYQKLKSKEPLKVDTTSLIKIEIENAKYEMPNTSTDTKIKAYFVIGCISIGLLGVIISFITRKKRYE